MKVSLKVCVVAGCCVALAACASTSRREYVKEGASDFDRSSAMAECTYQIKLAKASEDEQQELLRLCMEGKGYRALEVR